MCSPWIFDAELLTETAIVHQVVAGILAASLLVKGDLRVRQKPAHDVRQLAQADRDPARVVEMVAGRVGQQHPGEDLGDVLDVNQQAHQPLLRKVHRLAAGGVDHDLYVVRRPAHLVRPGDVGGAHACDRHAVVLDVLLRLELVEDLVHRILAGAVGRVVLLYRPVTKVTLLATHRDGTRVYHALHAPQAGGLEAVVHPEDVEAHNLVRVALTRSQAVGEVDEPFGLHLQHGPHHVLELRDVPAEHRRLDRYVAEGHRARVQVHAHHRFAARDQALDEPGPDEARRADHQYRHSRSPRSLR